MEKESKIIMVYRSSDDSNKVSSATKNYLDKFNHLIKLNIKYINLDKMTVLGFLGKLIDGKESADIIYLWSDEELLIDGLSKASPNTEIRKYNVNRARRFHVKNSKGNYNGIAQDLLQENKYSLGYKEFWINQDNVPVKIQISTYDYELAIYKSHFHESRQKCLQSILQYRKTQINRTISDIKAYTRMIEESEKLIECYDKHINSIEAMIASDEGDNTNAIKIENLKDCMLYKRQV